MVLSLLFLFVVYFLDFLPDSRNDGNAYCVARHFVKPDVFKTGGLCFIELFIGKALQSPALNRHELSYSAFVPYAVPILRRNSEHRLIRFFDSTSLLTDFFSVGSEDCPRLIRDKDG